ncbi:SRPBCC family protein [Saccharopolyspora sp. NPDC000995]
MQLEHEFVVPVNRTQAWAALLDVRQVALCMPGATLLDVDGDRFTGLVKVKVGPITVNYRGRAEFIERDESVFRAVLKANGREERGAGTAAATVTATLSELDSQSTKVKVLTDLDITGKPAQFGRGVIAEVGGAIVGQFADRLSKRIQAGHSSPTAAPEETPEQPATTEKSTTSDATPTEAATTASVTSADDEAVLDLGVAAWRPVLQRIAPAVLSLLAGLLLGRLSKRRSQHAITIVVPRSGTGC